MKKYSIIYADPPWAYKSNRAKYVGANCGETKKHYDSLSIGDLKKMKVSDLTQDDCALFLWATFPLLQEALDLIHSWGFLYKTVAFTWVKTVKDGTKPFFGVGYYTRSNAEICLLAIKGSPKKLSSSISSVVISPRENHSKKPILVREKIVELYGDVPRLEMFAREKDEGWDVFGNEVKDSIIIS